MADERVLHGLVQKARLSAEDHGYRINRLADGWYVLAPVKTLARWEHVATLKTREALEHFLVGALSVEDHLPG